MISGQMGQDVLLCFVGVFFLQTLFGQSRRRVRTDQARVFQAAVVLGRNFSQMDGDYFTGFDKGGWYAGLRGVANVSPNVSINVETLFSQKGSKIPHGTALLANSTNDRHISFDFAEIPLYLKYKLHSDPSSTFIEIGPYYSRLLKTRIQELAPNLFKGTSYVEIEPEFKSSEIGLMAGFGFTSNEVFDITLRYSFALSKIYRNPAFQDPHPFSLKAKEVEFLRNYHMSLLVAYKFL